MASTVEIVEPVGQCVNPINIGSRIMDAERRLTLDIGLEKLEEARREGRYHTEVFALSSQIYARAAIVEGDEG